MTRILIAFLFVLLASKSSFAQTAEDSVKAVINKLFAGMKNADTILLKEAFADSAILQTIASTKDGKLVIRSEKLKTFVDFVGKQKKNAADEQISFGSVNIDGALASVWTPYKFYFNGQFSHCGANSFQLVRINNEWKIQYLIDTRRRQPCD